MKMRRLKLRAGAPKAQGKAGPGHDYWIKELHHREMELVANAEASSAKRSNLAKKNFPMRAEAEKGAGGQHPYGNIWRENFTGWLARLRLTPQCGFPPLPASFPQDFHPFSMSALARSKPGIFAVMTTAKKGSRNMIKTPVRRLLEVMERGAPPSSPGRCRRHRLSLLGGFGAANGFLRQIA